ncbi:hypothetical protein Tco_0677658 [Tanacetum coccineum]|uniref:Uncharacterized protein n=1 Tax=Tanacetum coccineum TaxID=301880 RepID=A0ABQ4XCU6_9ASTR
MANQEQNPPQQEQPFVAAKQVGFNLEDILLNTNNEVDLLYPEHNNKDYFNGIFGEVGVNTFRNAIGAHYLPHSSEYVAPPSIDVVRQWFPTIVYGEEVSAKGTLRKSLLPPRWRLCQHILGGYHHQAEEETKEKDKPVVFKSPKTYSKVESVSQGIKPRAQIRHKKPLTSSKQPSMSSKEAKKASFIIHSESASGNDALVASTVEVDPGDSAPNDFVPRQQGMNEGTKNTSYDHVFAGTDPHVLANQTKSVSEGLETVLTQPITGKRANSIASQIEEETSSTIKLEDLANDEDEDDEVYATKNVETRDTLVPKSLSHRSSQIQQLTNQVLIL